MPATPEAAACKSLISPLLLAVVVLLGVLSGGCASPQARGNNDLDSSDGNDATADPNPVAELTDPSDGECPEMDHSGISSFSSAGVERKVGVLLPDDHQPGLPVIFNFHGLTTPGSNPIEGSMSSLQQLADDENAVILMPEARSISLPIIGPTLTWGFLDDEQPDLTLFDDLRSCSSSLLEVDLKRLSTWGHSGGALWSSVLLMERSTSLAAVVEFSGGADISIPGLDGPFITYSTPERQVPVLLSSGGDEDTWPQGFPIVDFELSSDTLEAGLVGDSNPVVRCRHQLGHYNIPAPLASFSNRWNLEHQFGQASPFTEGDLPDSCQWVSATGR